MKQRGRPRKYPLSDLEKIVETLKNTTYKRGMVTELAKSYGIPPITVFNYLKKNNLVFE